MALMTRRWSLIALAVAAMQPMPTQGQEANRGERPNLLAEARRQLGGEQAFDQIRSLQVEYVRSPAASPAQTTPVGFTIVRPDRFQNRVSASIHTLSGKDFWQSQATSSEVRETARRNSVTGLAVWSLVFLLNPLGADGRSTKYAGTQTILGKTGEALEIAGPEGQKLTMLFDRQTRKPLLYSTPVEQRTSAGRSLGVSVRTGKLSDYRRVGTAQFPFHIDERIGAYEFKIEVNSIRLNPPGAETLFRRH
jgi:hypothetical protein